MTATALIGAQETVAPDAILEIAFGFAASKTLFSALELGLFEELEKGPSTASDIQRTLGLHGRGVRDFLDALVSMQLLERRAPCTRTRLPPPSTSSPARRPT